MTNNIKQAIIIGGGPAGVSAALYLARAGQKVCIIENGPGALAKAHKIDNYYGIAASGAKLYAAGLEQARSLGVEILQDEVLGVEYTDCFTLSLKNTAEQLQTEALVLATGSKNITLNLPGLVLLGLSAYRAGGQGHKLLCCLRRLLLPQKAGGGFRQRCLRSARGGLS